MELWVGALNLGFLYAFMTMGIFITFRIHDFPDITVDGSFTSGAATAAVLLISGVNPFLALIGAFWVGGIAGSLTALIHTRFNVNGLLAGILVMTGLYSINLHIMGRSNIPLLNRTTIISYLEYINPGLHSEVWICIVLFVVMVLFWLVVSLFFRTDLGITMRATGNNPTMAGASGVNVNRMKIFGVSLANGFVGIAGGLVAQYQGFADIGMGIGTVVIGLAAVIIGESILKMRSIYARIASVIVGSVIFRLMIAFALYVGMNPIDLKLLTALFVLVTLVISKTVSAEGVRKINLTEMFSGIVHRRRLLYGLGSAVIIIIIAVIGFRHFPSTVTDSSKKHKIGFVQISDHGLLNITRDSFVEEMGKIGYKDGENCTFYLENANGELPTVNTILDKFRLKDVDVVVPISTACTQAAINKIKDRPVVFATVANPFIIGAGESETEHLPNVTGVYGWVPMDRTMKIVRQILPGKLKIGAIWDPAHANSVFNVGNLQKAAESYDDVSFVGMTITSSSEVYQVALGLVNKDIDAFVLSPDNIVYSAFESVVKAARSKNIPIFMSDVERLADGALGTLGYDYSISGIQAAHLVDRILKGENPEDLPFERYSKISFGLNMEVAKELGLTIPAELMAKATTIYRAPITEDGKMPKIGVVQFAMEPNVDFCKAGILKALEENGYRDQEHIDIIYKNANADFSMINSIMQDFIRRKVDIIVPLSTPCVQSAVQLARGKDISVVFTYIFDPYRIGAAKTPEDHLPNMTGVACFPPIEEMLDLIKEMFPERKNVGIVWNSSEANSEAVVLKVREYASKIGLKIIEAAITSPAEVLEASRSLAIKGAEVFLNGGDNTLNVSFDSFVKAADEKNIPVFSVDSESINQGALLALGPNYYQTGYEGGRYLARILNGENPEELPILQTKETLLYVNMDAARKHGFTIDDTIVQKADKVIDSRKDSRSSKEGIQSKISAPPKKLSLFLFNDNLVTLRVTEGIVDELERSGILEEKNITIDQTNAQNEFSLAQSITQDIVRRKYDYIITLTTPVLQVMAKANKDVPHVFTLVTDPFRAGVAEGPYDHPPNLTGLQNLNPLESTIRIMRELFPGAERIGIAWNPGEVNSEVCTQMAREAAKKFKFELLEATVIATNEVMDAVNSLLTRGVDLFLTSGDNMVQTNFESIAGKLKEHKIPYFTNNKSDVSRGAFITYGTDYYLVGAETGRLAVRVINGENPKDIPIRNYMPERMYINPEMAKIYGIKIPDSFLKKADKVLVNGKLVDPEEFLGIPSKKSIPKKLALFLFSDHRVLLETVEGVQDELKNSGILKDQNITIDIKNAQNEFYLAQSIAQDIVRQKYNYIITISTPCLQVMANTNKKIPHVFGAVSDPYRMGVAKNTLDHLPNVTGVATLQPVDLTIKIMREIFPDAKKIGIVWNPGEACSEACTYKARDAAKEYNFELLEANVSSTSEVLDALKSLIFKEIDLFITSGDNTVMLAVESIANLLKRHKIPYFTNSPSDIEVGAFISIGADYYVVGGVTARVAIRVINGEDPKDIPINNFVPEKIHINLGLADLYGIDIPQEIIDQAEKVLR